MSTYPWLYEPIVLFCQRLKTKHAHYEPLTLDQYSSNLFLRQPAVCLKALLKLMLDKWINSLLLLKIYWQIGPWQKEYSDWLHRQSFLYAWGIIAVKLSGKRSEICKSMQLNFGAPFLKIDALIYRQNFQKIHYNK